MSSMFEMCRTSFKQKSRVPLYSLISVGLTVIYNSFVGFHLIILILITITSFLLCKQQSDVEIGQAA